MLKLFDHNQTAYRAALELMGRSGKAAVIHPTGTGKSIIAFKLVEEHPDKQICWLSPSIYIVRTQRENVCRLDPNFSDENVSYYTYARLMNMAAAELREIQPDYIILDEFHRCGAAEWGKGVQAMLQMYPETPILGLSATNIRYLDNQRDMADELFDGNVSSEMTIAEAIATGILPAPVYVTALYSYQQELDRLERRVNSIRHRSNYDVNRQYLDALHRALEHSIGLDKVFEKHIRDRSGKYIVFCSGKEHMNAVREQIPEWFSRIDKKPHIYCVLFEDPGSEASFAEFKMDASSHLKLLLCIDMLSEGIHVDDISSVILLRPTTSPIVYKQQIGRALAAGKQRNPLIFDIVNNFDNLQSVSALQAEIWAMIEIYRNRGEGERVVDEAFQIYDEVRECRALFNRLEVSLTSTWDVNYLAAKSYYDTYGDLNVPAAYRTENNVFLGNWITYQRQLYRSKHHGSLTPERIEKLNRIGMVWENRYDNSWETVYIAAEDYYVEHGNLAVPSYYQTEDGILLGRWLRRQADNRDNLSDDKIERLNAIGMIWHNQWESRFFIARNFLRENPGYEINQATVIGNFWVGKWLVQQVRCYEKGVLRPEQSAYMKSLIEETGISAESVGQKKQREQYRKAELLIQKYGSWKVSDLADEERKTSRWIQRQIRKVEKGKATPSEQQQLKKIGVVFEKEESPWMTFYRYAQKYYDEHGDLKIPTDYISEDGVRLGTWLSRQRGQYKTHSLSEEQIALLEAIAIQWNPQKEAFDRGIDAMNRSYESHGNLVVPINYKDDDGFSLYQWMCDLRKKKERIPEETVNRLTQMGFEWRSAEQVKLDRVRSEIIKFLDTGNSADVPYQFKTGEGFAIGRYLNVLRNENLSGKYRYLTPELRELLDAHGMKWE